ncbi:hypothetical protein ACJ72_00322 [Emergomyces africanus]|uniref:Uncharacterized protein n=1 Tax=Emergomyces africanus TaxID=1955775 RepID=A0A1B7P8C8_9EURO|nr:hypothetical protein ACJ72_00322 [Emergomyces africanus]
MRLGSLSLHLGLVGLCAIAAGAASVRQRTNFREIIDSLNITREPDQFAHLGNDGILRVFSRRGAEVVGYARLTGRQLEDLIIEYRDIVTEEEYERLRAVWARADSSKVNETQIWDPSPELLPRVFTEENQQGLSLDNSSAAVVLNGRGGPRIVV